MSGALNYLALIVFCLNHVVYTSDYNNTEIIDTNEFDEQAQKHINSTKNDEERLYLKKLLKAVEKKDEEKCKCFTNKRKQDVMGNNALAHFRCAITEWKTASEKVFPQSICKPEDVKMMRNIPPIPTEIADLNSKNDDWINEFDKRKANEKKKSLEDRYREWYCKLTIEDETQLSLNLVMLREALKKFQKGYAEIYQTKNITASFAANIARGYCIVCATHNSLIPLLEKYYTRNPGADLAKALQEMVSTWSISEELMSYMNILRSVSASDFTRKNGKLTLQPIESYHYTNGMNEDTIIPLLDSDQCSQLNVDSKNFQNHLYTRDVNILPIEISFKHG